MKDRSPNRTKPSILADDSWSHNGDGIGRYSQEILRRIPHNAMGGSHPALHPLHFWETVREIRTSRPDVFFTPGFNPPLYSAGIPYVFSIADLIHLDFAEESSALKAFYYARFLRKAASNAYRVLTVSEYSKRAIVRWASIDPHRVVVNGNGVDKTVFRPEGPRRDMGKPYFFYVGNSKPHKNVACLIRGFAMACPGLDGNTILALTGSENKTVRDLAVSQGIGDRIRFTGRLSEENLAACYRGAVALVFPSLLEGFGLPALEAMACGTPVICSGTTSLPEVVGDAAILVDPKSEESISHAIIESTLDAGRLEVMRTRGLERSRLFDWDKVAEITGNVLLDACQVAV